MTTELNLLALITIICYFSSGAAIATRLFGTPENRKPPRNVALGLGFAATALHAIVLYQELITPVGFNLAFFQVVALVAWLIALLLLISSLSKPIENLAIVLLPAAGIAMILALRFPHLQLLENSHALGLNLHILISLLAYSLLTLAAVQAVLLAIQDQHLRNRHPGGFIRALPPLQTMETVMFEMIGAGFFLLSLALLSGFLFLENLFAQSLVHKTVLSINSWMVFAVILWGRIKFGWRGRTAIKGTLFGFTLLMLAYFGSKAVMELVLAR